MDTAGPPASERPRYRPPVGMPLRKPPRWSGVVATLIHVVLLLAILAPALIAVRVEDTTQGAGGPGPAGGGGGGRRGSGGGQHVVERLQYMQTLPQAEPQPQVVPPEEVPKVTPPPPEEKPETPVEQTVQLDIKMPTTKMDLALTAGIGGGTGNDGTSGSGPGSGGGVGSGVGTGRGSANGPGTGGGEGQIYPPTPDFLVLPPLPKPQKVAGQTVVLRFKVDERGKVMSFEFTPTSDAGYNRRIREQFKDVRFRPAVRWDGIPVPAMAELTMLL